MITLKRRCWHWITARANVCSGGHLMKYILTRRCTWF